MKNKFVLYYVEGETEEKLVNVLKTDLSVIRPGKVQKLNAVECRITNARLMSLHPGTVVVLVFDTDTGHTDILYENLEKLRKCYAVSQIITIPQVSNLEQELVRSCDIKTAKELLGGRSKKDFKTELIRATNLADKLREHQFDIQQFWSLHPPAPYQDIENQAKMIKLV